MEYILTTKEHIKQLEDAIADRYTARDENIASVERAVDQARAYCLALQIPENLVLDIINRLSGASEVSKRKAEMIRKWFPDHKTTPDISGNG